MEVISTLKDTLCIIKANKKGGNMAASALIEK